MKLLLARILNRIIRGVPMNAVGYPLAAPHFFWQRSHLAEVALPLWISMGEDSCSLRYRIIVQILWIRFVLEWSQARKFFVFGGLDR